MDTLFQQFINGLSLGAIYALIALGYTMVYGVLRLINFAHGDVYMLGAFAGYFIANALNMDEHPSILGAMAVCAGIGILIERLAYRPVRHHSRLTSLITAIGVSLLLEYGGQVVFGATPRFFPQMIRSQTYAVGGVQITNQNLLIIVVSVVVMFGLQFIVHQTKIGKAMRAVSFDREAAAMMGIDPDRVIVYTFFIGSALAGAAGVLIGLVLFQAFPYMGFNYGLQAFTAAVVGGIGYIPGAMFGGLLIGFVQSFSQYYFTTWFQLVSLSLLVAVMLIRPSGLFGKATLEKV